ncbi:uncharacterized protein LOC113373064 [Ctenocephalides felis]|uniref:uncharacterized protein LOC113373064 n=1 Tax=Ctenocephalides felis TaxID=7515 RepID=UPI000E6E27D9|nr:uncharacterized protein LOC113373064 [Ctenocephalides felis]
MYRFTCNDQDYLYTGKLCITSNILNNSYIKDLGEKEQIDTLICDSSIIDVPVDFNVQNAADKIESIIRNYSNMKIVISMDTFGMEDLLFEIACRGYSVYTGCSRNAFLRIQNADSYFTTSRDAVLRVVNKAFCVNIDDCYRRYMNKNIITIIPSAMYSVKEMLDLRKVGVHIVNYEDRTTAQALYQLIKLVKPIRLKSSTKGESFKLKTYGRLCRRPRVFPRLSETSIHCNDDQKELQSDVLLNEIAEEKIVFPVKQEDAKVPDVLVKISSTSDFNLDSLTSYFNHQQPGPNDPYISLSNDILLKSKPEEVLTNRQKMLKAKNKKAADSLAALAIAALEPFQKMHLFTKHKLQFMDDNFIDPVEMSKNLYRFHIQHHLDCIKKLKEEMGKIGGKRKRTG